MSEEQSCLDYLDGLRNEWVSAPGYRDIPDGVSTLHESEVVIGNRRYTEWVYAEKNQERTLVVLQLQRKAFIGSINFCVGAERLANGQESFLSMEDLWREGIP